MGSGVLRVAGCQPASNRRWAVELCVFTHSHVSTITYRVDVYRSGPIGASLLCLGGLGLNCSSLNYRPPHDHDTVLELRTQIGCRAVIKQFAQFIVKFIFPCYRGLSMSSSSGEACCELLYPVNWLYLLSETDGQLNNVLHTLFSHRLWLSSKSSFWAVERRKPQCQCLCQCRLQVPPQET